jgi:ATP-binding cassette subfamily B protein
MKKKNIINSLYFLYKNIDFKRRVQLLIIIILNIINGTTEFITLASASLFLESLSNPVLVKSKLYSISKIFINFDSNIVSLTTSIFILFIILSTLLRIFNLWISMKFRISLLVYIEEKIFKNIIYQELDYHIDTSSTNIINDLTKNIDKANFFIENLLSLITSFILSISLVIGLLNLSYLITILSVFSLSILYILIGIATNEKIKFYGKNEIKSSKDFLQVIQESLGAIKDIILSRKQNFFLKRYKNASYISRRYQGLSGYITTFPRYLFEGIGLVVLGLSGYIVYTLRGSDIIPLLGTFALGSQKLLPSMQTIYRSWQLLYFYDEGLNRTLDLMKLRTFFIKGITDSSISFKNEIKIKNLSYKYSNSDSYSLNNINISIKKGEHIGIMGITGSGKTTFINILMGLLNPSNGEVLIDGINLFDKKNISFLYAWRKKINHVPQKVFLINSNLVKNIALGIPENKIDMKKIKFSIKRACLEELLKNRSGNYYLPVGEDGIKLSGGQKQRIGIARAIYNNSEILILDESTNALDRNTEKEIINNIFDLPDKKTIINISHSKKSLSNCDKIIEFREGKIYKITHKNEISPN